MDNKKLTVEREYTLTDVACYRYPCGRCTEVAFMRQTVVKTFGLLSPPGWCCVAQDDSRNYYCPKCSKNIGIGV